MDRRLIAEARAARFLFALAAALSLAAGLGLIGWAAALSQAINAAHTNHAPLSEIAPWLALAAAFALLRAGFTWAAHSTAGDVSVRLRLDMRRRLLGKLIALGPAYTRQRDTGEIVAAATRGIDALEPFFRDYLPATANAVLLPLVILLVVLPLDALTFVVMVITAPLIPLFMVLIGKAAGALAQRQYGSLSRLSAHFLDVIQGLTTLKLFNRSRYQIQTIGRISKEFGAATMGVLRVAFLSAFALEMLATLSVAIIAVEIGLRLLYGGLQFEQALLLLVLAPEFYQPLRTLGARFHAGAEAKTAADQVYATLALPEPPRPAQPVPAPPGRTLRFEDVTFAYTDASRPALSGVSFTLQAGEHVALVGASGAGKSTIAALLLGFHTPQAGRILVDGIDLAQVAPEDWHTRIAWVPQSPALFSGSAAENIRLGRPSASLEDVRAAARAAEADAFIEALPQGYDTPLGERGLRLSGGQAQRIALARAFLHDAPLLVLDEFTSYLDPTTEAAVQAALGRLLEGRSALVIAHRLATIRAAGRILMLDQGQIVASGTHDRLLRDSEAYRALIEAGDYAR
ncbi:MAG TPA: thiol reductant ABC exporter subunit CydD [Candidatus Limnocylindrales bacterium]|nr:thiol reductant ABC exporter subunit CydD [Candidatus Limnocylindrales bacterium]